MANGSRPTAKKFGLSESTVRGFIKSMRERQLENPNEELVTVPQKEIGRHTLLPTEIDQKVMEMINTMRESGAVVNYNILTAVAVGIVTANDRTMLRENGGTIEFGRKWCESMFKRLGYVKRKSTTAKPIIAPGLIPEIGLTFYKDINEIVQAHGIPAEMIINIDQTPLPFFLISKYTMAEKGVSRVAVPGTADYRQITGTFGVTLADEFLPPQLIYQGKTKLRLPKFNFPKEFHVTQTQNHWAFDMLKPILIPYIDRKRKELDLEGTPWLLISDVFKAQWTDNVKEIVQQSNGKMVPVPSN